MLLTGEWQPQGACMRKAGGGHQARSCLSLRTSYAFWISLKRSSASSSRCWFLSAAGSEIRATGGGAGRGV